MKKALTILCVLLLLSALGAPALALAAEAEPTDAAGENEPAFAQSRAEEAAPELRVGALVFWCCALLACMGLMIFVRIKQR
ncbi:MAG: hypothetical protein Q4C01_07255 [Clostridia bacterium]|nr:hypothetical protein [Clostridia bacterium]